MANEDFFAPLAPFKASNSAKKKTYQFNDQDVETLVSKMPQIAEARHGGAGAKVSDVTNDLFSSLYGKISPSAKAKIKSEAIVRYKEQGFARTFEPRIVEQNDVPDGPRAPEIEPEQSFLSSASDAVENSLRAFGGGLTRSVSDLPRAAAYAAGTFEQDDSDGSTSKSEYLLGLADTIDFIDAPPPEFANSGAGAFFSAAGEIAGLAVSFLGTAGIGTAAQVGAKGAAKLGAKAAGEAAEKVAVASTNRVFKVLPSAQAAAQGAVSEVDQYLIDRKESGEEVDPNTARMLLMGGAAMGIALETRLPKLLSKRLDEVRGPAIDRARKILQNQGSFKQIGARAARAAAEEAGTESLQAIGSHVMAQALYEEDKDLYAQLVEVRNDIANQASTGAQVGAALSITFDALGSLTAGRRLKKSSNPEGVDTYTEDDNEIPVATSETIESSEANSAEQLEREGLATAINVPAYLRTPAQKEALEVTRQRMGTGDYLDQLAQDSGLEKSDAANKALQTISEAMNSRKSPTEIKSVVRKAVSKLGRSEGFLRSIDSIYDTTQPIDLDAVGSTSLTNGDLVSALQNVESGLYKNTGISARQAQSISTAIASDNIDDVVERLDGLKLKGNDKKLVGAIKKQLVQADKDRGSLFVQADSSTVLNPGQSGVDNPTNTAIPIGTPSATSITEVGLAIDTKFKQREEATGAIWNESFAGVYSALAQNREDINTHRAAIEASEGEREGQGQQYALALYTQSKFGTVDRVANWLRSEGATEQQANFISESLGAQIIQSTVSGDFTPVISGSWYQTLLGNQDSTSEFGSTSQDAVPRETSLPAGIVNAIAKEVSTISGFVSQKIPAITKNLEYSPTAIVTRMTDAGASRASIIAALNDSGVPAQKISLAFQNAKRLAPQLAPEGAQAARENTGINDPARGNNPAGRQTPDDGIDYSPLTGIPPQPKNMYDQFRAASVKTPGPTSQQTTALVENPKGRTSRPNVVKQQLYKWASADGRLGAFGDTGKAAADAYKHMVFEQNWRASRTKANAEQVLTELKDVLLTNGLKKYSDVSKADRVQWYQSIVDSETEAPAGYEGLTKNIRENVDVRSDAIVQVLARRYAFVRDRFGQNSPQEIQAAEEFDQLKTAIEDNKGSYMNRSYRVHENFPEWERKLNQVVEENGVKQSRLDHIVANDSNWSEYPDLADHGDRRKEALKLLNKHRPRDKGIVGDLIEGMRESKDILRARKDVPDWARAVLGEKTDPVESYIGTISKMDSYLARAEVTNRFMDSLFTADMLRTNNDANDPNFVPLSGDQSNPAFAGSMFKGFYMDERALAAMGELGPPGVNDPAIAVSNMLNGYLKSMMTLGNVDTHFRNSFGAITAIAANGNLTVDSMSSAHTHVKEIFRQNDKKVPDEHIEFLLREGILLDSAAASEIFDSFNNNDYGRLRQRTKEFATGVAGERIGKFVGDISGLPNVDQSVGTGSGASRLAQGVKSAGGAVADAYRFPDGYFRVANFYAEYQKELEAGVEPQQAKLNAAKRTRDTMPGANESPLIVKSLRSPKGALSSAASWAIINPFITPVVASVYTTGNRMRYAFEDISSGEVARRNSGIKAIMSTGLILGMLEEWANPDDDEENGDRNTRIYLREHQSTRRDYEKGIDARVEYVKPDGSVVYNTTQWSNTYSAITGLHSIATAKDLTNEERFDQLTRHALNELGGQSITIDLVRKITDGVSRQNDDGGDALAKALRELTLKVVPKDLADIIKHQDLSKDTTAGQRARIEDIFKQANSGREIRPANEAFNNIGYAFRNRIRANDNRLKNHFKDPTKQLPSAAEVAEIWKQGEVDNLEHMKVMIRDSEKWREAIYSLNGQNHSYGGKEVYNWLRKGISITQDQYRYMVRAYHAGNLEDVTVLDSLPDGKGMLFDENILEKSMDRVFEGTSVRPEDQKIARDRAREAIQILKDEQASGALRLYAESAAR